MKIFRADNQLKLCGKAWQIQAKLKELAKSQKTLKEYLELYGTSL